MVGTRKISLLNSLLFGELKRVEGRKLLFVFRDTGFVEGLQVDQGVVILEELLAAGLEVGGNQFGVVIGLIQENLLKLPDQGKPLAHHLIQTHGEFVPLSLKVLIKALVLLAVLRQLSHKVLFFHSVGENTRLK